jgi:hypothetical protein
MKYNPAKSFPLLIALSLFLMAGYLNNKLTKPLIEISKEDSALNFNADFLNIVSLGQRRLISSFLWISTLLESDLEKFKSKENKNSWMYMRFKSIANLDPLFYNNYYFGATYLGIIKDDLFGAEDIFLHGLNHFINDYKLTYNLAFLYIFEMNDLEKGEITLEKLNKTHPTRDTLKSLLLKIKKSNNYPLESIFNDLYELYLKSTDEFLKERLRNDLYSIKAEIDLKCLNNCKSNCICSKIDYFNNFYIYSNSKWESKFKFNKFELYLNKND